MSHTQSPTGGPDWLAAWSPADFDRRLTARGHKRDADDQSALFHTLTPTAETRRQAPRREELDGQGDLFGGEPS